MSKLSPTSCSVALLLVSNTCLANGPNIWIELGSPGSVTFKFVDQQKAWAVNASKHGNLNLGILGDTFYFDKSNNQPFDAKVYVLSFSKLWSKQLSLGYADLGLGLGLSNGSWGDNCEDTGQHGYDTHYYCDAHEGTYPGIQLLGSTATTGQSLGLGLALDVFIQKDVTHSRLTLIMPIGRLRHSKK